MEKLNVSSIDRQLALSILKVKRNGANDSLFRTE